MKLNIKVTPEGIIEVDCTKEDNREIQYSFESIAALKSHVVYDYVTHKQFKYIEEALSGKIGFLVRGSSVVFDEKEIVKDTILNNVILINNTRSFLLATLVKENNTIVPLVIAEDISFSATNIHKTAKLLSAQLKYHISMGSVKNTVSYAEFQEAKAKMANVMGEVEENTSPTEPEGVTISSYGAQKAVSSTVKRVKQ